MKIKRRKMEDADKVVQCLNRKFIIKGNGEFTKGKRRGEETLYILMKTRKLKGAGNVVK